VIGCSAGRPQQPVGESAWPIGVFEPPPDRTHSIGAVNIPDARNPISSAALEAHRHRPLAPAHRTSKVRFATPTPTSKPTVPDGYDQPLFRLRWTGNRQNKWAFAVWLASKDGYEDSVAGPVACVWGPSKRPWTARAGLYLQRSQRLGITRQRFAPRH